MSFLQSAGGLPDFNKAVISLWFRVPQASVDAAKKSMGYDPETMIGGAVIPLLTFGNITEGFSSGGASAINSGSLTIHTGRLVSGAFVEDYPTTSQTGVNSTMEGAEFYAPVRLPPSAITVDCSGNAPCIFVNLQTPNRAHRTGMVAYISNGTSSSDVYAVTSVTSSPPTDPPPDFMRRKDWITIGGDITDFMFSGSPEMFYGRSNVLVTADVWHHLLLSFDLSGAIGNGVSDCRMWMALDDVNYVRDGLPALTDGGHGPNTIFAQGGVYPDGPPMLPQSHPSGWYEVGDVPDSDPPIRTYTWIDTTITGSFEPSTYRFKPEPLVGSPINVPAPGSAVRQVQMAELQIFTGVTLDTSVEKNRRAFINAKGQPVDEAYGVAKYRGIYGPKTPNVTPSAPIKLLGRRPDVAIVRSARNWMSGFDFNKTSFRPNGKILPVKPDPVLGG